MAESENEILVEDNEEEIEENEPLGESGDPGVSFSAWIYSNYFEFVREKDERNISVKCKLCCAVPGRKTRELSTAKKSTSNLKKHLEKVHPNTKLKLTWKRKADDAGTSSNIKQQKLDFTGPARTERLEPKEVRRLVAEYIVEDMKPLSTVESPAFRTLVGKIPVKTDKILSSPDFSCRMNFPDPSRPVSVKQEEPEDQPDLSNIPYLCPLLANMNPVVVLHELPLNMVRQALHPPAHLQQCSSDEEEKVNHSDTCWEPKDDGGNDSVSDWSHSKSRSNGKKQKKGRKLNKDVPSTTQTSQPNTNDILHMVVCKEEVSPEQEQSPSLLQEEPEPPHIKEEQEELLQRPEEPNGSMLTLLAVKSEVDDEDISSHCYEVEVKVEPDTEVTEDGDDLEETSGVSNALSAAEQALLSGDLDKLFEALKAMGIQNLQGQNKEWYLKQLQADRESKEQTSPGEALSKDELQSGVNLSNEIAEGYVKMLQAVERINSAISAGVAEKTVEELMNPYAQLPEVCTTAADLYQRELSSLQQQSSEGSLSHPELLLAVEMLSSVVLMNHALDVGDRAALWKQLSSSVTGLHNVEDEFAQRYMDELMRLKAAGREEGVDYLTWNDIHASIDNVNQTVQEEHERVRSHSSQIQSFSCSECPSAFTSQIWLHKHIRQKHGKEPFHCTYCDKSFAKRAQLNRHQFVHNDVSCKQCCKSYTHSDGLKRHQLDTSHGEKRFYCTLCKRGFGVPCALKTHQLVHTGEKLKPFHCKDCDHGWTGHLAYQARLALSAKPSTHCLPLPSSLVS